VIDIFAKKPKILVIGDLMVDQYLWGESERISPEAPVQVIDIKKEDSLLGGAGNVINNLHALGAHVDIISVIGNCYASSILQKLIKKIKIDTKYLIIENNRIASKKTRIISDKQQVVRFDREITDDINKDSQKEILKIFKKIVLSYEVVLLSDYGKGVLTYELTQSIITFANMHDKKVLIDPKGSDYSKYKGAFLLTPNKKEAINATQIIIKDDKSLTLAIQKLKKDCKLKISLITLSDQGIAIYDDKLKIQPTKVKEVFDVTGAGDTVLASLGFGLACGFEINQAVIFANLAAGVVVGKIGSATATLDEIATHESNFISLSNKKNIKTFNEISEISKVLRAQGKKVVFTNGCFDILHTGHIKYLESARNCGDILIIGLNSDASVKNLKGVDRPINNQLDRAILLLALRTVDYVVIFDDISPYKLIQLTKPHVLVKGGDYEGKKVIGADLVDELKIVKFIKGKSTSNTIKKIIKEK
jgi:D-beta-D-heptose 7-phosphate kinase / D-beta-D-heptose 1-phosphate adenosyltransferase